MRERIYSEVITESIDFGGKQYWFASNKKYGLNEVIMTESGYFYNFQGDIYKIVWESWTYFGPLDLEEIKDL